MAQEIALDFLLCGKSDREAAEAASVSRQSVNLWKRHHPYFRAELDRRRQALFRQAENRLRSLLLVALDRLEGEIEDGPNGWRAALEVVKIARLSVGPHGWASPEQVVEVECWARRGEGLDALLAQANGEPIPEQEKARVLRELPEKAGDFGGEEGEHLP